MAGRRTPITPTPERQPDPGQRWKVGDEFLPFHPQASHIPADYRDGWNRCYWMAVARTQAAAPPPPMPDMTYGCDEHYYGGCQNCGR